jgi:hypothetical protein
MVVGEVYFSNVQMWIIWPIFGHGSLLVSNIALVNHYFNLNLNETLEFQESTWQGS